MPLASKSMKGGEEGGGTMKDSEDAAAPSNNLWVGNISHEVSESDLMALFAPYGALDSVTSYSSRSYGFVFFKRVEDAKAAKNALQGALLRAIPIKIEFARPAKTCKQLWVGGISTALTKEDLESEFRKFGKIEDFKFVRDRNTAFVEYFNLDDAIHAMKMMNGKRIGGDQIRVDFLRSQSLKKDMLLEYGQFQGKITGPPDFYSSQKRPLQTQASVGRKGEGQLSNILWIGYPPSLQIDEQMLHNAMILFGEIERIKSFPSRHYSFVEFRSVDEARRAKEGLQGRLFNDPRITIMYSSSELAPGKDYPSIFPGSKGPKSDMFVTEQTFRPLQMDVFGHNRPMVPNNFPGQLTPGVIVGPNVPLRSFGSQGSLEPLISSSEFNELGTNQKFQDGSSKSQMGPNWKRPSPPASGMLHSAPGIRPPTRATSSAWDVLEINQFQRDSKRSRIECALPVDDVTFPLRNVDDRAVALEQSFGMEQIIDGGSGPFVNFQGKSHSGALGTRISAGVPSTVQVDVDHIWRGIIAKGGTPVCQARCVPIGKGIGTELPDVVDCSARTGLDMLTKHYADAVGFDIVFFLPDSEDDFPSYTEFLRYLGAKNRAGVAKFVDGTTLFLVPPSDFLTNVLKVTGPERLYGVVLKFPSMASGTSLQQPLPLSVPSTQYIDRQQVPLSQVEYGQLPVKEEEILPVEYNRLLHDESKVPLKPLYPATSGASLVQSVPLDYNSSNSAAATQPGVTLTPELIATLASLLPGTTQSSVTDGSKSAVGPLTMKAPFPPVVLSDGNQSHVWKQDHQIADPSSHVSQQAGSIYYQPYPLLSPYGHPVQVVPGSLNIQDSAASLQHQVDISSRPMSNFLTPSQSGQEYGVAQKGYEMTQIDASVLYSSQALQNPNTSVSSSNQVHSANPSLQQTAMPYSAEKVNSELPNQQFQSALQGASQGTSSEVEADKNQRYQSTLQFAASLLLQIQQQQQNQGGRGAGNQQ